MKRRWKILSAVGVFFALVVASLFVTLQMQPRNAVEAYKKLLRDQGERLEIKEVLPPHLPAESNGVALVQSAFSFLAAGNGEDRNLPLAMRMVAPGRALVGWARPNLVYPGSYGYTNTWEHARQAADANRPVFDRLQQAAGYPALDFQIDYSLGPETLLPHLAPLKRCTQRLSAAAMCDLHDGNAAAAATNICTLLALFRNAHGERLVISQLVRIAMASIAASATWELLQATNLADKDLAALQNGWAQQEFMHAEENALLMERASIENTIRKMRASGGASRLYFGMMSSAAAGGSRGSGGWLNDLKNAWTAMREEGAMFMWRKCWSYADELRALQGQQVILETVRTVETNRFFYPHYTYMKSRLDALGITNEPAATWLTGPDPGVFSQSIAGLERTTQKTMAAEVCRQVAITAIGLKRFALKHGKLPGNLTELTPEFLPGIPIDPVDDQPLRYRPNPDGTFLLYSIGANGLDDGGDPAHVAAGGSPSSSLYWLDLNARDWVWPQPATPAEVQNYFDHPSN
jgi:hypothetical protein